MAVDANSMLDGHPLPDLTGAGPVEIAAGPGSRDPDRPRRGLVAG